MNMAVSPLEIPGQILVRGLVLPDSKDFPEIMSQLVNTLKEILKLFGVQTLAPLQERILFALESGADLFVTGPRNGGKRTAYLILAVAHVLEQHYRFHVTDEERRGAPSAIIVCESTAKGLFIKSMLQNVLDNCAIKCASETDTSKPKVSFIDNVHNDSLKAALEEPLDILILTGAALHELVNHSVVTRLNIFCVNYKRVRYIIFEELGMQNFFLENEVTLFLYGLSDKSSGQSVIQKVPPNTQLIFSGTAWQDESMGLLRINLCRYLGRESVMIFGSVLHAISYSRSTKWKIDLVHNDKAKLNTLIGICRMMLSKKRTIVIACSTPKVAMTVSQYISKHGEICNKVITLGNNGGAITGVFKSSAGNVYVVADEAMPHFSFHDASCLIHFDIDLQPNKRSDEEPFCQERFSCLWMRLEREWHSSVEPHGVTHLLVTGYEPNFLALYKFLQNANIPLPQSFDEIVEERLKNDLPNKPLCSNLKCFAHCNSILECPARHEIIQDDLDIIPDAPTNGELEFKVIKSHNPSLYVGKMLHNYVYNENGERACVKVYREEARERTNQMMDYYSTPRNRIAPLKISMDELFCIPFNQKPIERDQQQKSNVKSSMYCRAKTVRFVYFDGVANNAPVTHCALAEHVEVFCVDLGTSVIIPIAQLMILPEQFRKWKPHCVQVVLSNMLFLDETREYHSDALEAAKRLAEGKIWHGKVLLAMRDTVWINHMVQYEKDPVTSHMSLGCNLLTKFVNGNYVTVHNSHYHMRIMLEYIRKQDSNYPEFEHEMSSASCSYKSAQDFHTVGDLIQWNSIPLSSFESKENKMLSPVSFGIYSWITPWEIYGAICEDDDESLPPVTKLELELTKEIENNKREFTKFASLLKVGGVVAVRVGKNYRWQRGLILQIIQKEEEIYNRFDIFLVDYGSMDFGSQELEQVLPIPKKYVELLPFQAICLKLAHIQPIKGENDWRERDISTFYTIMNSSNKIITVAFSKVEDTQHPCNYYQAIAYQNLEGKTEEGYRFQEMGVQLVTQDCAEYTPHLDKIISLAKSMDDALDTNSSGNSCQTSSSGDLVVESGEDEDDGGSESSFDRWNMFRDVEVENDEYLAIGSSEAGSEDCDDEKTDDIFNNEENKKAIGSIVNTIKQKLAEMGLPEPKGELVCKNSSNEGALVLSSTLHENNTELGEWKEDKYFDAMEVARDDADDADYAEQEDETSALSRLCEWFKRTV